MRCLLSGRRFAFIIVSTRRQIALSRQTLADKVQMSDMPSEITYVQEKQSTLNSLRLQSLHAAPLYAA